MSAGCSQVRKRSKPPEVLLSLSSAHKRLMYSTIKVSVQFSFDRSTLKQLGTTCYSQQSPKKADWNWETEMDSATRHCAEIMLMLVLEMGWITLPLIVLRQKEKENKRPSENRYFVWRFLLRQLGQRSTDWQFIVPPSWSSPYITEYWSWALCSLY